ncbi:MAG: sugar phosphate isomerase/epimerase family protein [Anaerolineales bacterium]
MRIGFIVPKDMRQLPFEQAAEWGSENGFAAIDSALEDADACEEAGIAVGATHLPADVLTLDEAERERAQEEAFRFIDRAVERGITRAMIGHARHAALNAEENVELFREGYAPVAEYAEQYNFKLVMEIYHAHGNWLAITPELIRALFAAVPSKSLGICLDPSHLVVQGIDYIRATREFGERIFYAHAKDTEILEEELYEYGLLGQALGTDRPFSGWWRYRLPGRGEIDWGRFMGTLAEVGYDDVIAVEHEDAIWYGDVERNKRGLLLAKKYLDPYIV